LESFLLGNFFETCSWRALNSRPSPHSLKNWMFSCRTGNMSMGWTYIFTLFIPSHVTQSFYSRDILLGFIGMDPYSCLHNHVLLCSRGSMIYYLKGILGTLICYTLGYSFPQTTFLSLLKVFGVLVVFNEAQS
jgi:hypothetical protein